MIKQIFLKLEQKGYKGRIVSVEHIRDIKKEINQQYSNKFFDEEFYQERLTFFKFDIPDDLSNAKSIFIVAVPDPHYQITFAWKNDEIALLIPPTYLFWEEVNQGVENYLASILEPLGFKVAKTSLPVKLLAVHSGLAKYGRNNITYVEGMGSFFRLVAIISDFPDDNATWQNHKVMDSCNKCSVCIDKCPTKAITNERFLLKAESCISFRNEKERDILFPKWLNSKWHNCLVGCLYCQRYCPENKNMKIIKEGPHFSEEETKMLLSGLPIEKLPSEMVEKLSKTDLIELLEYFPRNLSVFLSN